VAYLIGRLTEPGPRDRFLDPACGAGTTLIERGLTAPARLLLGGDAERDALKAARESAAAAGVETRLACWDAARLPLRDAAVDRLAVNLPYGKRVALLGGSQPEAVRPLLQEMARALRPGGLAVVMTADAKAVEGVVARGEFRIVRTLQVSIRGVKPKIFVMKRT
jgi:23S rRNA G2445 N2-methylase RlmL